MKHLRGWWAGTILAATVGAIRADAQVVEMRFRETSGQAYWSANDRILDYVVEARVVESATVIGLGDWSFNIALEGELEGLGSLQRASSPNAISPPYRYLAGLSGAFNGVVNLSSGTFVNGPEQEIGLISGVARGAGLVVGGLAIEDVSGAFAIVPDPAFTINMIANFGADSNWSPLYTFRYALSDLSPRTIRPVLRQTTAATFANLVVAGTDFAANTTGNIATVRLVESGIVEPLPSVVSIAPATQRVFAGGTVVLSLQPPNLPNSITWRRNGVLVVDEPGRVSGASTDTLVIAAASRDDAGAYTCQAGTLVAPPAMLEVVCRSDFNGNDQIELADLFDYLNAWFAQCSGTPAAPCNGRSTDMDDSGSTNIADIFAFLNLWFGRSNGRC